jgi:hypothetical protein
MVDTPAAPDFGGSPLEGIRGLAPAAIASFKKLGFSDAEQVMAALTVPDVMAGMKSAIGASDSDFDDYVRRLREVVPMIAAAPEALPLGAFPPTAEIAQMVRDRALPQIAADVLPPFVNHASAMPPGKQQGSRGTCVSFAMTAVHEYYERLSANAVQDYSEQFLYHETKQIDGQPDDCGTWNVKAAEILGNLGQCGEDVWAYNGNLPCNNNGVEPATARTSAAPHKLATVILDPRRVDDIKTALFNGSVVAFSIPVYNSWYQSGETARTGRITMRIGNEQMNGGHAMCLIGYQDQDDAPGGGFFILRNSWFGQWGTDCPFGSGNGTIPYAYISSDCWEAVTTEPPPNYQS